MPHRTLDFSGRSVDLETGKVSDGGELRPMEVRLLAYLADRPDEIVSQAELLREVWQYAPDVRTSTLYTTVYRLRSALEADPSDPKHLVTAPGRGLRLVGVGVTTGGSEPLLARLSPAEASERLLQGIRKVDPTFDPAPVAADLDALVALLDGLSVGLEVAAPYVVTLGAAAVLESVRAGEVLDDPQRPAGSRSLGEVFDQARASLPPAAAAALAQLAAFGSSFTPALAAQVVVLPPGSPPVGRVLSMLVERGLVRADGSRLALLTPLRRWLGPPDPAAVERHTAIYLERAERAVAADEMLDGATEDDQVAEPLHAAHQALGTPNDPRWASLVAYGLRSGTRAGRRAEAIELAQRLLRTDLAPRTWVRLTRWWASQLERRGNLTEAIELASRIPEVASTEGMAVMATSSELDVAMLWFVYGRVDEARRAVDRSERWLGEVRDASPSTLASLRGRRLVIEATLSPTGRVERFKEAVAELRNADRPAALTHARAVLAAELVTQGQPREAVRICEIALAEAPPHLSFTRVDVLMQLSMALLDEGLPDEAMTRLDQADEIVARTEISGKRHLITTWRAAVHLRAERFDEAARMAATARAGAERQGHVATAVRAQGIEATVARRTGAPDHVDRLRAAFDAAATHEVWEVAVQVLQELADAWIEGRSPFDPIRLTRSLLDREDLRVDRSRVALVHAEVVRRTGDRHQARVVLGPVPEGAGEPATLVRLARAALAAELGDPTEALEVLNGLPSAAPTPWVSVWRARCAAAVGLVDEVRSSIAELAPRPWEGLLVAALTDLRQGLSDQV